MAVIIIVNGKMAKEMEKVHLLLLMAVNMWVIGKTINLMVLANKPTLMEQTMRVNLKMASDMEMAHLLHLMAVNMWVIGKTIN